MNNKNGFSLIELLISTALFSIAIIIGLGLLQLTQNQFQSTKTTMSADTNVINFLNTLTTTARLGVKISDADLNPADLNSTDGLGYFRKSFQYSKLSDTNGDIQVLAYFLRESRISSASDSNNISQWQPTALFFKPPTATTSGKLYLTSARQTTGSVTLSPRDSDVALDGITEISFSQPKSINQRLTSIKLHLTYRVPVGINSTQITMWCPSHDVRANTAGCSAYAGKDVRREVVLFFSNNKLNHVIKLADYLNGAYLFKPKMNN